MSFDGTDDYVDMPGNSALAFGTGDFAISVWINTSTFSAGPAFYRRIFMLDGPTGNVAGNFQIILDIPTGNAYFWDGTLSNIGTINVSNGAWHHIVATREGTSLKGYVDAVLDSGLASTYSTSVTANSGSPRGRLASYSGTDGMFLGLIDDVRIYNTALTQAQITKLAAGKYADGTAGTSTTTLGSALTVSNALTIQAGTLDVSASNYAVSTGTWADYGTWVPRSGTLTLTKTHTFTESTNPYALTINGASQTVTLGQNATLGSNLTITDGTLATGGYNLSLPVSNTFNNTGTFSLQGAETLTNLTNDTNSGTVTYTGNSTYSSLDVGDEYYNLTFNGSGTWSLDAALTVNNHLTITNGTLNLNGFNPTVAGDVSNSGTITNSTGRTVTLNGGTQSFNFGDYILDTLNVTGSSGTVSVGSNFTVSNLLSVAAGRTLSLVSYIITLGSNFLTNLGVITEGSGYIAGTSSNLYIADSNFDIDDAISLGAESVYISLIDQDGNLNGTSADTLSGVVISCPTDSEAITLTETGVATEVFRNAGLATAISTGSDTNNNGTLTCANSTTITATYTDAQDSGDTRTDTASATSDTTATAPSSFAGSAPSSTSITWTWTDNSNNETGFKLYDGSNNLIATISTANTTSYTETGLTKGTSYTRKVVAYNNAGNSSYSNSATVVTPAEPTAPSVFAGTAASNTSITWTWTDNANDENGFKLLDSSGTTIATISTANTTSYTETGLTKNTSYTRKVAAYNDDGTSTASNTATVITNNVSPTSPSLVSPVDGALTNNNLPTFTFKKSTEENGTIDFYTLKVGNQTFSNIPASSTEASNPASSTHNTDRYTAQYFNEGTTNTTNQTISVTLKDDGTASLPLNDGTYVWYVTATDTTSNSTRSSERALYIDATRPSISNLNIINPVLTATLSDTRALQEATVTLHKANKLFGSITSYTALETRTYTLTGTSYALTFTPRNELEKGTTYKYTLTVTDSAGNETTSTKSIDILSDKQIAQEAAAQLDPETDTTETIISTLRNLLPESPLNLVELQEQAVVRRQLQAEYFQNFFDPILAWLFNGSGVLERSLVASIQYIGTFIDAGTNYLANIFQNIAATAQSITAQTIAFVTNQLQSLGSYNPMPTIKHTLQYVATIFDKGSDVRIRQGLANRQEIDLFLKRVFAPIASNGRKVAVFTRHGYELFFAKEPTQISNVRISSLQPTSAVIEWDTNHLTRFSKVNYGTSQTYTGEAKTSLEYADHHRVEIDNLSPNTTYYFEVMSQNGEYVFDAYYTITTLSSAAEDSVYVPQQATIISSESVQVRDEPHPNGKIIGEVQPQEQYRALQEVGDWISLLLPSRVEGWIQKEFVTLEDQVGVSAEADRSTIR
ncbi:MAG: fibronectin type III domain-containing protein [bacterium]|nr:fibronectin type III domain-containing protein [bacterium]